MSIKVLDHGYVRLVEYWGMGDSDEPEAAIIEAARMSTGKGFNGWDSDAKLLAYLYEHKHMTPFEMCGMVIEVKAPIFVFREWHRHRTQSYNEMSARYIPIPDEHYEPDFKLLMARASAAVKSTNRQAQSVPLTGIDEHNIGLWLRCLERHYKESQNLYQMGLEVGVPKELARLPMAVGRYSAMRASANLRNWLQFLTLRMANNAQWEIRQYAKAVGQIIAETFPRTWSLFAKEIANGGE